MWNYGDSTWSSSWGHPVWNIGIQPHQQCWASVCNYQPRSQLCWESVGSYLIRPQPLFDWASGWKGKMADQTMASSRVKLLWECLYPGFPEWEFPLHGVWGNLAELYWEGLVWTPRRAFPRIPSAGSWERSRFAIADGSYTPSRGTGGDFRGRGRSEALRVVHGHV